MCLYTDLSITNKSARAFINHYTHYQMNLVTRFYTDGLQDNQLQDSQHVVEKHRSS
jgi:hypothetical protein